jgi:hypothetical protein
MRLFAAALPLSLLIASTSALSDQTGFGTIVSTQGHVTPACRTVQHRATAGGTVRTFRIADVTSGRDDIASVVLSALISNREVDISFDPAVTSGCGTEPRITHITIR